MSLLPKSLWKSPILAAVAYAGLAALDASLAFKADRKAKAARLVTKPLLMPTLAHATYHSTQGKGIAAKGVLAGQAASFVGDVALLGRGTSSLRAGMASFGAAHLGYTAAFASVAKPRNPLTARGVQAGAAVFAVAGPLDAWAAGRVDPRLRLPVLGYAGVISTMLATSTLLDPALSRRSRATVLAGAALFVVSDSILGAKEFLLRKDVPALEGAVMATYSAGQGLIALGIADATRQRSALGMADIVEQRHQASIRRATRDTRPADGS